MATDPQRGPEVAVAHLRTVLGAADLLGLLTDEQSTVVDVGVPPPPGPAPMPTVDTVRWEQGKQRLVIEFGVVGAPDDLVLPIETTPTPAVATSEDYSLPVGYLLVTFTQLLSFLLHGSTVAVTAGIPRGATCIRSVKVDHDMQSVLVEFGNAGADGTVIEWAGTVTPGEGGGET